MFDIIIEQNVENVKPQYMGVLEILTTRESDPHNTGEGISVVWGSLFYSAQDCAKNNIRKTSAQIDSFNILADDLRKQLVLFVGQSAALFLYGAVVALRRPVKQNTVT